MSPHGAECVSAAPPNSQPRACGPGADLILGTCHPARWGEDPHPCLGLGSDRVEGRVGEGKEEGEQGGAQPAAWEEKEPPGPDRKWGCTKCGVGVQKAPSFLPFYLGPYLIKASRPGLQRFPSQTDIGPAHSPRLSHSHCTKILASKETLGGGLPQQLSVEPPAPIPQSAANSIKRAFVPGAIGLGFWFTLSQGYRISLMGPTRLGISTLQEVHETLFSIGGLAIGLGSLG